MEMQIQRWIWLAAALAVVPGTVTGCLTARPRGIGISHRDPSRVTAVAPRKLYRSGQLGAWELRQAIADHGIRTVVNLRGEPDPDVGGGQGEQELCASCGVRYVHLPVELYTAELFPTSDHPNRPNPLFVEEFLGVTGDRSNWPVLVHCAGGRHRTGVLVAAYRIEQEGWSATEAYAEMLQFEFRSRDKEAGKNVPLLYIWGYLRYLAEERQRMVSAVASTKG